MKEDAADLEGEGLVDVETLEGEEVAVEEVLEEAIVEEVEEDLEVVDVEVEVTMDQDDYHKCTSMTSINHEIPYAVGLENQSVMKSLPAHKNFSLQDGLCWFVFTKRQKRKKNSTMSVLNQLRFDSVR